MNADLLADTILSEVLEDTVRNLEEFEDEEAIEDYALSMMDSPTLAQILRRMEDMEVMKHRRIVFLHFCISYPTCFN